VLNILKRVWKFWKLLKILNRFWTEILLLKILNRFWTDSEHCWKFWTDSEHYWKFWIKYFDLRRKIEIMKMSNLMRNEIIYLL
jgi:hypothetical protein